jgi:hypothetical protein
MPVQYYDGRRRDNPETQAIKRLMFAVLADAVRCLQTYADAAGFRPAHNCPGAMGIAEPADSAHRSFGLILQSALGYCS